MDTSNGLEQQRMFDPGLLCWGHVLCHHAKKVLYGVKAIKSIHLSSRRLGHVSLFSTGTGLRTELDPYHANMKAMPCYRRTYKWKQKKSFPFKSHGLSVREFTKASDSSFSTGWAVTGRHAKTAMSWYCSHTSRKMTSSLADSFCCTFFPCCVSLLSFLNSFMLMLTPHGRREKKARWTAMMGSSEKFSSSISVSVLLLASGRWQPPLVRVQVDASCYAIGTKRRANIYLRRRRREKNRERQFSWKRRHWY